MPLQLTVIVTDLVGYLLWADVGSCGSTHGMLLSFMGLLVFWAVGVSY